MNTKLKLKGSFRRSIFALFTASALLFAAQFAEAQIWDVATDFSLGSNPNGDWSYGLCRNNGTGFTTLGQTDANGYGEPGLNTWYWWQYGNGLPSVYHNTSNGTIFGIAPGGVGMHPYFNDGIGSYDHSVVLWTAPATGDYQFNLSWNYVGGGDGVTPSVTRNISGTGAGPTTLIDSWQLNNLAPTATWLQSGNAPIYSLAAGETMAFAVNNGLANDYGGDGTAISLNITVVPEPSTFALLAGALVCGAVLVRSRRQRSSL